MMIVKSEREDAYLLLLASQWPGILRLPTWSERDDDDERESKKKKC